MKQERAKIVDADMFNNLELKHYEDKHNWLNIRRINKKNSIDDSAWRSALRHRLGIHEPSACQQAVDANPEDHYHTCRSCAGSWWIARHNTVQQAFAQCARDYGIVVSFNFKELFNVGVGGQSRERPDLIVFGADDKPWVLDFSIAHQSAGRNNTAARWRHTAKIWRYEKWQPENATIKPFVTTTKFTIPKDTTKLIEETAKFAARPGFQREVSNRVKVAQINFEGYRARLLRARNQVVSVPTTTTP
jgi:hypothetical protein